jgi:DNA-binding XRE family transcriptional regulator
MTTTTEPPTSAEPTPQGVVQPNWRELLPPPRLRRELRRIQGLTQEQAAAPLGVTDGSFSNWESRQPGPRNMRAYLLCLLRWADDARTMGFPISWPASQAATEPQE